MMAAVQKQTKIIYSCGVQQSTGTTQMGSTHTNQEVEPLNSLYGVILLTKMASHRSWFRAQLLKRNEYLNYNSISNKISIIISLFTLQILLKYPKICSARRFIMSIINFRARPRRKSGIILNVKINSFFRLIFHRARTSEALKQRRKFLLAVLNATAPFSSTKGLDIIIFYCQKQQQQQQEEEEYLHCYQHTFLVGEYYYYYFHYCRRRFHYCR